MWRRRGGVTLGHFLLYVSYLCSKLGLGLGHDLRDRRRRRGQSPPFHEDILDFMKRHTRRRLLSLDPRAIRRACKAAGGVD